MAKPIHMMVTVLAEAISVDFHDKAFGLKVAGRFEKLGLEPNPIKEFHRDGAPMARFFLVQDPDGHQIEMLQRHGRCR